MSRVLFVPDRMHVKDCWAYVTCQARHTFGLLFMHPYNLLYCQVSVSLIQFTFFPSPLMPISCPSIKNAPRWLVKGRWDWRLGLFKNLSQLFKAKFDSENGGGLINHAEVFQGSGTKCNASCSDKTSINSKRSLIVDDWLLHVLTPRVIVRLNCYFSLI